MTHPYSLPADADPQGCGDPIIAFAGAQGPDLQDDLIDALIAQAKRCRPNRTPRTDLAKDVARPRFRLPSFLRF